MIQQLIEKYCSGQCTEAEKEKIRQYFRENPTEAEDFFSEEEWEKMDSTLLNKTGRTEGFIDNIITTPNSSGRNRSFYKWVIAAAVIACIGLAAAYFFQAYTEKTTSIAQTQDAAQPLSTPTITQKNEENKIVALTLPDGTEVQLSPHSEIKYIAQFESNKRDLYLEGEAVFHVAKDASRPFTVYCKEVATTAIGTTFKVSLLKDNSHVSVILIEGKIVVKSTVANNTGNKYYLLPGNEIQYNRKSNSFITHTSIEPFTTEMAIASPSDEEMITAEEGIKINTAKKAIQFNDVSMGKVLNIIAHKYGVSIAYPTDRISAIRFVGTIRENESVQKILSDITLMNNLELVTDTAGKKYTIR